MHTTRSIVLLAGSVLLVMGMIPGLAWAHEDDTPNSLGGGPLMAPALVNGYPASEIEPAHNDLGRFNDTIDHNGVSGNYITEPENVGGAIDVESADATVDAILNELFPIQFANAAALCDAEVIDGGQLDETNVEGHDHTTDAHPPAEQPDGTWDDGGIGGACHTNYQPSSLPTQYDESDCNTGDSQWAHAQDVVSGDLVTILTGCDWGTSESDPSPVLCAVNVVLENIGTPDAIPDDLNDEGCLDQDRIDAFIACQIDPLNCAGTASSCVPEGFADASELGVGGGHGHSGLPGTPYPAKPDTFSSCSAGVPVVWALTGVLSATGVTPAVAGWIDSTPDPAETNACPKPSADLLAGCVDEKGHGFWCINHADNPLGNDAFSIHVGPTWGASCIHT